MTRVIKLIELASGHRMPEFEGKYLKSYDPDGHGGLGDVHATANLAEAMRFPDVKAAMDCWMQTSTVRPRRPDGKPNRPLTAFTIETFDPERASAPVLEAVGGGTRLFDCPVCGAPEATPDGCDVCGAGPNG